MMKLAWGERAALFLDSHRTVPQAGAAGFFCAQLAAQNEPRYASRSRVAILARAFAVAG
jgi:hypothetical protein